MNDIWVCEYSPNQDSFHVTTLDWALDSNVFMMTRMEFSGYIPLGAFRTAPEAHQCAAYWEAWLRDKRHRG